MDINMIGICKSFGANKVLGGVNLHVRPGEVHALMGENGAGKSTLMNILTGIHKADAGTIMVDGKEVTFRNNKDAEEHGIAFIHQELNIWPNLSVLENLFLMNQPKTRFGTIDFKKMREMAEAKCQEIGIELPLDEIAGECSVGQQQMTEITRSLMLDAKTVIMDEPTAALTERETDRLFDVMRKLKNKGVSIIYISHRMEEVFANCDTITVMRDGQTISSRPTEETNMDQIVGDMVGRVMSEYYPARTNVPGDDIKWNEEDRDKLVAKLESMYQLGVRAFAVFFDDIGKGKNAAEQADLLNYINRNFIQAKGDVRPLIMCPSDYNRSRWHPETAYLETLGDKLDADIHIMWTGDRALSDITADNLTWVQTILKRRPYIWWNFPVTDFSNDRILMGKVIGITPAIRTDASAFVSNPMEYAEASKLALFSVANYTWNINAYDAEASWQEGIRSLLPDAAEAFACFCRHSSATGTDHFPRPESECIRRAADRFVKQYTQSGNWQAEDMQTLKDEFDRMALAADELKLSESNPTLTHEIAPWITAFGLWAQMGQEALELAEAVKMQDYKSYIKQMNYLQVLQRRIEQNNHIKQVSIGTAVIQPLINEIMKVDYQQK